MALSAQALQTLSKAITEEVVEEIFSSDAYVEFMMRIIPDVIQEKMGALDDELLGELAFMAFDNINIVPARKVSQWGLRTLENWSTLIFVQVDSFLTQPQLEELEDFWTLDEDECSYDDSSFEQLLDSCYDF